MINFIETLAIKAGISTLLAKVFVSRGITNVKCIKDFLNPRLDSLHDPFLLETMDAAVERIIKAVDYREMIMIYGDYDVDGVTSTSILYSFLSSIGANVDFYIPDRQDEGYGLSSGAVEKIKAMGTSLIVTVDCGTTAIDEVRQINDEDKKN